jgi:hypothetical protein
MADNDNIVLDSPNDPGETLATNQVDGRHFQKVKVTWGADDFEPTDATAQTGLPVDLNTTAANPIHVANVRSYVVEVGKGNIPGDSIVNKFGENPDVDDATFEDLWDGGSIWAAPTAARIHDIASTLAADAGTLVTSGIVDSGSNSTLVDNNANFVSDGVAVGDVVVNDTKHTHGIITAVSATQITVHHMHDYGNANENSDTYRVVTAASTGAFLVHVQGLDANGDPLEEHIIPNGTNDVETTGAYRIIFRMQVDGAGTGDGNAGVISATAQTDGTVTAQINANNNQTLMAIYQVPNGKECCLVSLRVKESSKLGATCQWKLLAAHADSNVYQVKATGSTDVTGTSSVHEDYSAAPMHFDQLTTIKLQANSDKVNSTISGAFDMIISDVS